MAAPDSPTAKVTDATWSQDVLDEVEKELVKQIGKLEPEKLAKASDKMFKDFPPGSKKK